MSRGFLLDTNRLRRDEASATRKEHLIEEKIPAWFQDRILPVTREVAERWGTLDAERQLVGRPLNIADGLIASTALEHNLVLVTRNGRDFAGLSVTMLNPWETNQ